LFLNTNSNVSVDTDLASLISMNIASADLNPNDGCNGEFIRSAKNYNMLVPGSAGHPRYYDEDDCVKKPMLSKSESGWCCWYE